MPADWQPKESIMPMDPVLKEKWLEALRSGRYVQGRGRLRTREDKYCCLGVLCDVVDSSQWIDGTFSWSWGREPNHSAYAPPLSLLAVEPTTYLASMNDEDRASFPRIADWIEENL